MCIGCLRDYVPGGNPLPEMTQAMTELVSDIRDFYEDFPSVSELHVILDDWNLKDEEIDGCLASGNSGGGPVPEGTIAGSILRRLRNLSLAERATVLARLEGYTGEYSPRVW